MRFRNLISDLADDCIVILSSHIVSDIDTIADEVAIMKNGTLLSKGNQEEIIALVKGRVFETDIAKDQLNEFKTNQLVVSTARKDGKMNVRYISDQPTENSAQKEANLEDAYLYITRTQ